MWAQQVTYVPAVHGEYAWDYPNAITREPPVPARLSLRQWAVRAKAAQLCCHDTFKRMGSGDLDVERDRAALNVWDVSLSYDSREVLCGVSVEVPAGTVVGIVGPNGVGKTTLLRCAAGVGEADTGQFIANGVRRSEDPETYRRQVGYLPDVGGVFARLTGWEHLELTARLWGLGAGWEGEARYLLERLGLTEAADALLRTYSHGMTRRLGVCVAMLARPPVVLLDEPFDGVDPLAGKALRKLVAERAAGGDGVVLSTHLLDVAAAACDVIHVMAQGRIIASGADDELCAQAGVARLEDAYVRLVEASEDSRGDL